MPSTIDRLVEYIQYKGLNNNKVTSKAGLSIGLLGVAIAKGSALNSNSLEKLLSAFPDLSPDWLLTGKGEMLRVSEPLPSRIAELEARVKELETDKAFLQELLRKK